MLVWLVSFHAGTTHQCQTLARGSKEAGQRRRWAIPIQAQITFFDFCAIRQTDSPSMKQLPNLVREVDFRLSWFDVAELKVLKFLEDHCALCHMDGICVMATWQWPLALTTVKAEASIFCAFCCQPEVCKSRMW